MSRPDTFSFVSRPDTFSFYCLSKLAKDAKAEEEALGHYRRVRDEIRKFVESLPEKLMSV